MLKVSLIELLIRGIPEDLLFIFAAYTFSKRFIEVKRLLLSSFVFAGIVYLIRLLPIQSGADFILNLVVLITLTVFINRIDVIKAIKSGIMTMLIVFICEGINVFTLQFILKKNLNIIFKDPITKMLYASPSLVIFGGIVIAYYISLWKRNKLEYA